MQIPGVHGGWLQHKLIAALDFKDAAIPRSGNSDVVFDLFIETSFFHFITLLSNFSNFFSVFLGSQGQYDLTLCQKYHSFRLLSISADD